MNYIGEYEVIEIPKITDMENFKSTLKNMDAAKQKRYQDLDIGASMTSLRNPLRKFQQSVKNKGGFKKLFDDNDNIRVLAENLQKNLHGAAPRPEDSIAYHYGGATVTGYEAESMIFMVYSLYKMVFEKLKGDE